MADGRLSISNFRFRICLEFLISYFLIDFPMTTEQRINRLQLISLLVGVIGAVLCAVGVFLEPQQFFRSYLMGYVFWWKIAAGCLALALLNQMVAGAWGLISRPFFDAACRTWPLVALLFVPLAFGVDYIYPWTERDFFAGHEHLENRTWYLTKPFFLGRAAMYFAVWLGFGLLLGGPPAKRHDSLESLASRRLGLVSGAGMVLLVLTASFAAIDWLMTLDPFWHSTIFGGLVAVGGLLTAMALVVASIAWLTGPLAGPSGTGVSPVEHRRDAATEGSPTGQPPVPETHLPEVLNDLGNLLLAFLMVWTYFAFSQYLIIWSGNLPEEAAWYLDRQQYGWGRLAVFIILLHFVVPFLCLLSRDVKQSRRAVAAVAVGILVMHYVELFWTAAPSYLEHGIVVHWLDVAAPLAVGGLWLAFYAWQLQRTWAPVAGLLIPAGEHTEAGHG
jgi:hypothetical protein